jgi:hypothetical protein
VWIRRAWQIPPVERLALGAEAVRRRHALVEYLKFDDRRWMIDLSQGIRIHAAEA